MVLTVKKRVINESGHLETVTSALMTEDIFAVEELCYDDRERFKVKSGGCLIATVQGVMVVENNFGSILSLWNKSMSESSVIKFFNNN